MHKTQDLPSPQLDFVEQGVGSAVVLSDSIKLSLYKKSKKSGFDVDTLEEVFLRGWKVARDLGMYDREVQEAFSRVNSFIAGGVAAEMDKDLQEKRGLWDNIHAKRRRIERGSHEHMRRPGEKGRPTAKDFKLSSEERERSEPRSDDIEKSSSRFDGDARAYIQNTPGQEDALRHIGEKKKASMRLKTIKTAIKESLENVVEICEGCDCGLAEALYHGKEVPLNKPMKGDVKKSKVFVKDPSTGNVKKVNFGDKKLSIKKDIPARKRSYCARSSGQGNLSKKTSANYWSRRAWNC